MRYSLRLLVSVAVLVLIATVARAQEVPREATTVRSTEATALPVVAQASAAQQIPYGDRSRARGFFVGASLEGNAVAFEDEDETDSGSGFGLTLGYGFTSTVALYGQLSAANIDVTGGSYNLGHFDIGVRVHFLAPAKRFVPFVQGGLSGRGLSGDIDLDHIEFGSPGFAVGGGINIHFKPALALTTGITWTAGNVDKVKVNGTEVPVDSFGVTTARFHVGIIWFPQGK